MVDRLDFKARYGGWAMVAGASEGIGAAYAEELASRGLNLILIARRLELLQLLASHLSNEYQVKVKILVLDLSASDAVEQIHNEVGGLEIGLLVYNAAFSAIGPFLERPFDDHLRETQTNVLAPLKLVYLFASQMLARGHG